MEKLMKIFLTILIGVSVAFASTQVWADDETDLLDDGSGYEDLGGDDNEAKEATEEKEEKTETETKTKTETETETENNVTKNNTSNNTSNNVSSYNNTNLPKTGVEDAMPIAALVAVFGISAVFAYKKISDYKNI